jgi:Uncharacterised nucleotidyltransferase
LPLLLSSTRAREAEDDSARPFALPIHATTNRSLKTFKSSAVQLEALRPKAVSHEKLNHEQLIRQCVLLTFLDPLPQQCLQLQNLSASRWRHLLRWLDYSGLALYFFDRIAEFELGDLLPELVFARLQQHLIDNTERTRSMTAESIAIQQKFQATSLRYAALKGLSFWPHSVPKPELRSQFDMDFLVTEKDIQAACAILEREGYRLYATNGRSWEFKRNEFPGISRKEMYKDTGSWAVELHVESSASSNHSLLDRLEWREFGGFIMPVLSPIDLFLGQGLHAYKHICSEFSRAAHLLEFRRHVLFHRDDAPFWNALRSRELENPRSSLGLGVVTLLIAQIMGEFAPESLTSWTVDRLPRSVTLWVEIYGHRAALGSFPGSKLYLLLQQEIEASGLSSKRSVRQSLIPSGLPPPVIRASPNETFSIRLGRYRMQLRLIFGRLRFHLIEGAHFVWESHRWRRRLNQVAR